MFESSACCADDCQLPKLASVKDKTFLAPAALHYSIMLAASLLEKFKICEISHNFFAIGVTQRDSVQTADFWLGSREPMVRIQVFVDCFNMATIVLLS